MMETPSISSIRKELDLLFEKLREDLEVDMKEATKTFEKIEIKYKKMSSLAWVLEKKYEERKADMRLLRKQLE